MSPIRFQKLDVREMIATGNEPFPVIRAVVNALRPGSGLTVLAPFVPSPLIEKLKSEGFSVRLDRAGDGSWSVDFWRD